MWQTIELDDKSQILSYLEQDRLYAAYAIGDLEPDFYEQCTWVGAAQENRLRALVLQYRGLEPPALLLIGETDGLRAILADTPRPERVYATCREEHLDMTRRFYRWSKITPMWRMALRRERFVPMESECTRLTADHAEAITRLFADGGGIAFSPFQVAQGVFWGAFVDRELVAVAGTHLVSPTYGVAAVGNVYTQPAYRGQGYGTATTSAVVVELLRRGIRDIVLNVSQANEGAIRIYGRLGFERTCPFLEGPASALSAGKP
jgi:ribosomal protein S18 acetylase RimI-like enzyme